MKDKQLYKHIRKTQKQYDYISVVNVLKERIAELELELGKERAYIAELEDTKSIYYDRKALNKYSSKLDECISANKKIFAKYKKITDEIVTLKNKK